MIKQYLALDVGAARIGVALANDVARIASPLPVLANDESFCSKLRDLTSEHHISQIVVGWPRGLDGQETEQTRYVENFISKLDLCGVPVVRQDEALTSVQAEAELKKSGKNFTKGDIDSLSAVYILEDFLAELPS
ncbi:Holliday junction resolvase RuvX [Candidatus Saccharibacteria bacterium]|jgi:putative Holliday junction resolvase|nr:Holliday junction resolvase RuvX [Candidatus Saccharibacteria bacterium]